MPEALARNSVVMAADNNLIYTKYLQQKQR